MGSRGWQEFSTPRRQRHCKGNSASESLATCASKSQLLSRTSSYHPDMQRRRSVDDESSTCNKVRERYLHRLGISSMTSHFNVDNNKIISTSLPEKASSIEQQQNQQDSIDCDEDNIILLRQSIKYTTE